MATAISVPLLAVTTIGLARLLGVSGFGRFALYGFVLSTVVGFADLGVGTSILRRGALAANDADPHDLLQAVRAGSSWSLLQLPVLVIAGILVLPSWSGRIIYGVAMALSYGFIGPSHFVVMTNDLRLSSLLKIVAISASSALSLSCASFTHRADLTFALGALGITMFTAVQGLAVPKEFRRAVFMPGRLMLTKKDVSFGLGSLLNGQLSTFVFSRSELLFFSSGQSVARGQFAGSQTVAARSTLLLDALLGNAGTALLTASRSGQEDFKRAFASLSQASVALFALYAPLGMVSAAILTAPLLGAAFTNVAGLATVLALMSMLQSAAGPLLNVRFGMGSIRPLLIAGIVGAAADAALAFWLVPPMAASGAGIANVGAGSVYVGLTVLGFRSEGADWYKLATAHMCAMAEILVVAGVAAAIELLVPPTFGFLLALPLIGLAACVALRLPHVRLEPGTLNGLFSEVLPFRVSTTFSKRLVIRRLLNDL